MQLSPEVDLSGPLSSRVTWHWTTARNGGSMFIARRHETRQSNQPGIKRYCTVADNWQKPVIRLADLAFRLCTLIGAKLQSFLSSLQFCNVINRMGKFYPSLYPFTASRKHCTELTIKNHRSVAVYTSNLLLLLCITKYFCAIETFLIRNHSSLLLKNIFKIISLLIRLIISFAVGKIVELA